MKNRFNRGKLTVVADHHKPNISLNMSHGHWAVVWHITKSLHRFSWLCYHVGQYGIETCFFLNTLSEEM